MKSTAKYATEAELVAAFCSDVARFRQGADWTIYPETAGFDLLMVEKKTGIQLGLEAKLSLNVKVVTQSLPGWYRDDCGPDYRGVLVPAYSIQAGMTEIAQRLGIGVIAFRCDRYISHYTLPDEQRAWSYTTDWHPWLPTTRCALPEYVPDVTGGHPAPVQLTDWKIRAIKLLILLDRRGFVTRADMKHLGLSASRWTAPGGYLVPKDGAFVRYERTPDFRGDHPKNTAQIESDFEKWAPPSTVPRLLTGEAA